MIITHLRRGLLCLLSALLILSALPACQKVAPSNQNPKTDASTPANPSSDEPAEPSADAPAEEPGDSAEPSAPTGPDAEGLWLPTAPDDAEEIPDDGILYVEYAVNYKPAGTVKNGGLRKLNGQAQTVEAVANFGYRFVRWSDGLTDPVRADSIENLSESTILTAIFDYDLLDMPVIAIDTETGVDVRSKKDYIHAEFRILGTDTKWLYDDTIQIRGRGNNSWGYEKKSYKMKFPEKVNLFDLGTGKDKVWVLLANVCDQSLQRNHVALELTRSFDGVAFSPASLSVEVYLNGEYRGVYLLAEEIRDSKARVNIDTNGYETETDIGYLLELSSYADGDVLMSHGKMYKVHSDLSEDGGTKRSQIAYISDYLDQCYNALKGGDRAEIEALMDIDSMVDTYLAEEVVKNLDVGWDSYYLYKEKGGKLFLGPIWDFDLSLGNANEGEETIDGLFAATRSGSGGGNPWYYMPMAHEWFRELVVARWDEVKASLIDTLPGMVREEGSTKLRSYERNFIRWPIFGTTQNRETEAIRRLKTYTAHYEYLASWIEQRIAWLDETYHQADFTTMRFGGSRDADDGGYADENSKKLLQSLTDLTESAGVKKIESNFDGFGGEGVENLLDGEAATKYCWEPWWGDTEVTFSLKKAVSPTHYALMTANDTRNYTSRNPQKWTIYGSNDGKSWEKMAEVKDGRSALPAANFCWTVFAFDTPGEYQYYKVVIVNDGIVQFGEMALLG